VTEGREVDDVDTQLTQVRQVLDRQRAELGMEDAVFDEVLGEALNL